MFKEDFLKKAYEVHGGKYSYELSDKFTKTEKIKIVCPIHGEFYQTPKNHLNGQGCPECGKDYVRNFRKGNYDSFLKSAYAKYGNEYSYPNIKEEYVNNRSKITIVCNNCGKKYIKIAAYHLSSNYQLCKCKTEDYIDYRQLCYQFKNVVFSLFYGFKNIKCDSVYIICPIHGSYKVRLKSLYKGHYLCKKCSLIESNKNKLLDPDYFVSKISELTNNTIQPFMNEYVNTSVKMHFKCNVCGNVFVRKPNTFLSGNLKHLCPYCGKEELSKNRTKSTDEYIDDCIKVYGIGKYDYSLVNYISSDKKVTIKCNECGRVFDIEANSFLQGHGCPYHNCNSSGKEKELFSILKEYDPDIISNDRKVLNGKELDIYSEKHKLAIEFDGIFWHNENNKDKNYHLDKTIECNMKGIRLIHIFEDEWINKKEIWLSMLKNIFNSNDMDVIYARKCEIREVSSKDALLFLNENHLQGKCNSSIRYGLYYNNELVSLMTFGNTRHFIGSSKHQYELLRFCNKLNTRVIGSASKLLKHFIKEKSPKSIVSYADRRWSIGNLYNKLGFKLYNTSNPSYYYVIGNERKNRFNYRKSILVKKYGCPENMSEHEFCRSKHWWRIYDCGCLCYELILIND